MSANDKFSCIHTRNVGEKPKLTLKMQMEYHSYESIMPSESYMGNQWHALQQLKNISQKCTENIAMAQLLHQVHPNKG